MTRKEALQDLLVEVEAGEWCVMVPRPKSPQPMSDPQQRR